MFDSKKIKKQFPIFEAHPDLVYLDNAATSQKPRQVIDAISNFYVKHNSNIHRGLYALAADTSKKYEAVRKQAASFLNAQSENEIIFTSGTTEGINMVANSFLKPILKEGDQVLISIMEHHANLIPWQKVCEECGANLKVIELDFDGSIDFGNFESHLNEEVKLLAIGHISNAIGSINPVKEMIEKAHGYQIPVLVDGAQSVAHYEVDMQELNCDFFACSGHKMYGPTGIGILYGKSELLKQMTPFKVGGDMIKNVTLEKTEFAAPPARFEAGTVNIAGVFGLSAALDFIQFLDLEEVRKHLAALENYSREQLLKIEGLKIFGSSEQRSSVISFYLDKVHPHDVSTFLGAENLAVRAGQHCAQPLMDYLGISGTTRLSFGIFNTFEEVDKVVAAVKEVNEFFG